MDIQTLLIILAIGAIAGWLAGVIMKGGGYGLLGDIVIGTIGAFVGGTLFGCAGNLGRWFDWTDNCRHGRCCRVDFCAEVA